MDNMDNDSLNAIREHLSAYVGGTMPYEGMKDYLVEAYRKAIRMNDGEALKICRAATWEIAEYSEGLIDESELRRRLASLQNLQTSTSTSTSTSLQVAAAGIAVQPVGVGRASVFAWKNGDIFTVSSN
jgi:hypothetical protein